jgi:lysyl-tRNA synthetase class 2
VSVPDAGNEDEEESGKRHPKELHNLNLANQRNPSNEWFERSERKGYTKPVNYSFENLDPFEARRAKLQAWRDLGVDPYPARIPAFERISAAREKGNHLQIDDRHEGGTAVAGRLTALRGQGAIVFADVTDVTGKLQLLFKQDVLSPELFERVQLLDLADFIHASGQLFVSKRGELTLEVHDWQIIGKTLHPLPDSWKGLQDLETKQRQRYLDLLVNDGVRDRFLKRSKVISAIRRFMEDHDFVEVETPTFEHVPGGADAEPFVTHHNALDTDFYLRISLELHLKRLVAGGMDRVFEIGKVFRNEGMSPQHLQEFTEFEFYWAYADYQEQMQFVQEMFQAVIQEVYGTLQIERGEHVLDFSGEWPRVSYVDVIKQYAGVDVVEASDEELVEHALKHSLKTGGGEQGAASADDLKKLGRGRLVDLIYKKTTRPHLIQPQFLCDFPVEFSPLAKRKADNPRLTERFAMLVDGFEVSNSYSELNDPIDQRQRFEEQEKLRLAGDAEAQRLDEDFLRAMEHGMPPMTGFGMGIDRLVALLSGVESVRETVLFPTMRPSEGEMES